jgi:OmpA family protein
MNGPLGGAPSFGQRPPDPPCPSRTNLGFLIPEGPCLALNVDLDVDVDIDGPSVRPSFFCLDSDVFRDRQEPGGLASFVRNAPASSRFLVHGYASAEGDPGYNRNLACHRAKRVARELLNAGVRSEQIDLVSRGPTRRFGRPEQNRVVRVRILAPGSTPPGPPPGSPRAIVDAAVARIMRRDYRLAADAYISEWTCGRIPNLAEALKRTRILIAGVDRAPLSGSGSRLGIHPGVGHNTIVLSQETFSAADPVECVLARIVDLSFHHMARRQIPVAQPCRPTGPLLPGQVFDEASCAELEVHQAALFLVELAGIQPCRTPGQPDLPGLPSTGSPPSPWWARPVADPLAQVASPCPPTRLIGPVGTRRVSPRQVPTFRIDRLEICADAPVSGGTLWSLSGDVARMATPRGVINARAEVTVLGPPAETSQYEVGFLQTILYNEEVVEYVSGHTMKPLLPVPIRDGPPRTLAAPPWFMPPVVARPDARGRAVTTLSDSPARAMPFIRLDMTRLMLFNRPPLLPRATNDVINRASRDIRFLIWLVARRRDAPLDRFNVHFLGDGAVIHFHQDVDVSGRTGTGSYQISRDPASLADQALIQLGGPTPAEYGPFPHEQFAFGVPTPRAIAGGLTLEQWRRRVRDAALPHRRALGAPGSVMVHIRIDRDTGRVALPVSGRPAVTAESDSIPRPVLADLSNRLLADLRKDLVLAPVSGREGVLDRFPTSMTPLAPGGTRSPVRQVPAGPRRTPGGPGRPSRTQVR